MGKTKNIKFKIIRIHSEEYKKAKRVKEMIRKKYGMSVPLSLAYAMAKKLELENYKSFFEELKKMKKENESIFKDF